MWQVGQKAQKKGAWQDAGELFNIIKLSNSHRIISAFIAVITLVILANAAAQIRLNSWQGTIYDAIGQKNVSVFIRELGIFAAIVSVLLCFGVAQTWLNEMLKIRLRDVLTRDLLGEWLKPVRAYRMSLAGNIGDNPDQRVHDDTRRLAELTTDLGVGLLQSSLMLLGFIGVLWQLSADVTFAVGGSSFHVPGYMVWCAILYALLGSFFTWLVGNPLTKAHTELRAAEADFRFELVRVNEAAEAVALHGGEAAEQRVLITAMDHVIAVMRRIAWRLSNLNWVTGSYGWVGVVAPMILAAPGYFSGSLSLGGLMMVVGAFYQVQNSLRWYVDRFPAIAEWSAMLSRVMGYRRLLVSFHTLGADEERFETATEPADTLSMEKLCVRGPNGNIALLNESILTVAPGERVLITGSAKSGKSVFFKALAGLWVWGSGTLRLPPRDRIFFLPSLPYIPIGTLKTVLTYPSPPEDFSDEEVSNALERVQLGRLLGELTVYDRWDKHLNHDEQQRAVFVRVLLHKPLWVVHDETLSELEEETARLVESLIDNELKGTAILNFGRGDAHGRFFHRVLRVRATPPGLRLPLQFIALPEGLPNQA